MSYYAKKFKIGVLIMDIHHTIQDILDSSISAAEIARATGISHSNLSAMRRGDRSIDNLTISNANKLLVFWEREKRLGLVTPTPSEIISFQHTNYYHALRNNLRSQYANRSEFVQQVLAPYFDSTTQIALQTMISNSFEKNNVKIDENSVVEISNALRKRNADVYTKWIRQLSNENAFHTYQSINGAITELGKELDRQKHRFQYLMKPILRQIVQSSYIDIDEYYSSPIKNQIWLGFFYSGTTAKLFETFADFNRDAREVAVAFNNMKKLGKYPHLFCKIELSKSNWQLTIEAPFFNTPE